MSLVQFVLTKDFIVVGAETRVYDKRIGVLSESCNKLIKIGSSIVGCSGNLYDCGELLDEYCTVNINNGIQRNEKECNLTYNDFIQHIIKKYERMKNIHENDEIEKKYDFTNVICGYNGREFVATVFGLSPIIGENRLNKIQLVKIPENEKYVAFAMGSELFYIHDDFLKYKIVSTNPNTILQYRNIMKDVVEHGIKMDDSINNNMNFERLRKKDVINDGC